MKTEPTEAYEAVQYYEAENINIDAFRAKKICDMAFYEGQSSPIIKQLEWVEVNSLGEMGEFGIKAKTSFGDYEVYEKSDHDGYVLWCLEKNLHIFDTEMQAKMYAQADFEKRVMECLDL